MRSKGETTDIEPKLANYQSQNLKFNQTYNETNPFMPVETNEYHQALLMAANRGLKHSNQK